MQHLNQAILTAVILVATSVAYAADEKTGGFDGFAAASLGHGESKYGSYSNSGTAGDAQLTLGYTDRSGFGGQLDIGYFKQDYSNYSVSTGDTAAHLYYRNQAWLIGAFLQQRHYSLNGDRLGFKGQFLGLEGQYSFDDMTLYGQLGQAKWKYDVWGTTDPDNLATIELRYFVADNYRIDGSINYMKENFGTWNWQQTTYAVGVEYRLQNNPLSISAKLERADEKAGYGFNGENTRLMLGVKYNFGKDSLRKSDRDGSSLRPVAKNLYIPT